MPTAWNAGEWRDWLGFAPDKAAVTVEDPEGRELEVIGIVFLPAGREGNEIVLRTRPREAARTEGT